MREYNADAESHLQKAVKLDPTCWEAWNALGSVLFKKRDLRGSLDAFDSSVSVRPNAAALRDTSIVLRQITDRAAVPSNIRLSVAKAKSAVSLDLKNVENWTVLGTANLAMYFAVSRDVEDLQRANQAYARAAALEVAQLSSGVRPDLPKPRVPGTWEPAAPRPDPDLHYNRGQAFAFQESYDAAIQEYLLALATDPQLPSKVGEEREAGAWLQLAGLECPPLLLLPAGEPRDDPHARRSYGRTRQPQGQRQVAPPEGAPRSARSSRIRCRSHGDRRAGVRAHLRAGPGRESRQGLAPPLARTGGQVGLAAGDARRSRRRGGGVCALGVFLAGGTCERPPRVHVWEGGSRACTPRLSFPTARQLTALVDQDSILVLDPVLRSVRADLGVLDAVLDGDAAINTEVSVAAAAAAVAAHAATVADVADPAAAAAASGAPAAGDAVVAGTGAASSATAPPPRTPVASFQCVQVLRRAGFFINGRAADSKEDAPPLGTMSVSVTP